MRDGICMWCFYFIFLLPHLYVLGCFSGFPEVVCGKMARGKVVRMCGRNEGSKWRGPSGWLYLRFNRCRTVHTFPFLWMNGGILNRGFGIWCRLYICMSGRGGVFFGIVERSRIDIDVRFIPFPSQDIVSSGIVATTIHPSSLCITSYHLISHPIASYDHQPSQTQWPRNPFFTFIGREKKRCCST